MKSSLSKTVILSLMALLIVGATGLLTAAVSEQSPSPLPGLKDQHPPVNIIGIWRDPEMAANIGLDTDQITQIKNEDFRLREKLIAVRSELDMAYLKLDKALTEASVKAEGVLELAARAQHLEDNIFLEELATRLKIAAMFEPEKARQLGLYDIPPLCPPAPCGASKDQATRGCWHPAK